MGSWPVLGSRVAGFHPISKRGENRGHLTPPAKWLLSLSARQFHAPLSP